MNIFRYYLTAFLLTLLFFPANPQSRIKYNKQDLFLSGANLAWVNFAHDIGPGITDFNSFSDALLQIHDNGGNALRWWLHVNGSNTPEFNDSGLVTGPKEGTIKDIKEVLDLAWEREVGIIPCLWSFDMLRSSGSGALDSVTLFRNRKILTDSIYTQAYINNCLIPMVDSLKGHPGIIAWEIFNEPEGMSTAFGWIGIDHVLMSDIQRFINLCAGAIHRTDTSALVTSGSWSFQAMTDVQISAIAVSKQFSILSKSEQEQMKDYFNLKYRLSYNTHDYINYLEKISAIPNYNYYRDDRLIEAGHDTNGTLDFYSVHYYPGLGRQFSPFTHSKLDWSLDKPVVVAEFAMEQNNDNVPKDQLFFQLYQFGYAGALPWSWTDVSLTTHGDMLNGMKYMWDHFKSDVDVNGISGDWPNVSIIYPLNNAVFPDDSTSITIQAVASDSDGHVVRVEFFANDTIKIGERDTLPYNILWTDVEPGIYSLTAVATDDSGLERISGKINIVVGTPPITRLEENLAVRYGQGMTVVRSPSASGGGFLDINTNEVTNTITWTLPNVPEAGTYEIKFGYMCHYDSPKDQFININGIRSDTIRFEGSSSAWLEKGTSVKLRQGRNTIQMQLWWGYMYLDYLAVPTDIAVSVDQGEELPVNYSLDQNYPNPFNPETKIKYSILKAENVKLSVYDILGRRISVLVDEKQNAGFYIVAFDGNNLASGVYFYKLETESFTKVKKMMLVK
ncbi:MAG TPA: Ig-like domain-containing protein [Ignavibacteriaceae bacterium]|nr:Ig-like domain-containing protein [Ignavibacteriaceae bacterium]